MADYSTNFFGASIDNSEITDGAVSGSKIAMGSDARGDILYRNATQYTRLAAGSTGQFLQTQGAAADPQWATIPMTLLGSTTLGAGATSISVSITAPPASYKFLKILIYISGAANNTDFIVVRLNADSGANYIRQFADDWVNSTQNNDTGFMIRENSGTAASPQVTDLTLANPTGAIKPLIGSMSSWSQEFGAIGGYWNNTADITSVAVAIKGGGFNLNAGSYVAVYGM